MPNGQVLVAAARREVANAQRGVAIRRSTVHSASVTVDDALPAAKSPFVEQHLRKAAHKLSAAEQGLRLINESLIACVALMQAIDEKSQSEAYRILGIVVNDIIELEELIDWLTTDLNEAADHVIRAGGEVLRKGFALAVAALQKASTTMDSFESAIRNAYVKTRDAAMQ